MTLRHVTRRELLQLAASAPVLAFSPRSTGLVQPGTLDLAAVARAPWRVTTLDGAAAPATVQLTRVWYDRFCELQIRNTGAAPVALKQVACTIAHAMPADTPLYGEGFQMLSQTGGTVGAISDLGNYTDAKHYRLPEPEGARVVHNLVTFAAGGNHQALAFTSCRRFSGSFHLRSGSIDAVLDLEGLALAPGETWKLEELSFQAGGDREALLASLARRLAEHHKPLTSPAPPSGWCSWYCFGPNVTASRCSTTST